MIGRSHFVHKFKNLMMFLPILHNECVKDILFEHPGIVLVHYMATTKEPYMFTIYIEYKKSPFDLIVFLESLENLEYEALVKEIEKKWLNIEGLPLSARSMDSKVR